ncbi:hypothetical protein [Saccharibacillus deserti]|uniref:hypothetical protein n=1 Tax=Saccharibacillus deserti TaxID=1634444 RepID=UPI001551BA5C|nr:hypothetical protein [Saccharibacillus deserti]
MPRKKLWIPAAACMLALTACSPNEWANNVIEDRVIQVKRYPDQQKPYVGYSSGFKGVVWKKGGETQLRKAWENVPEAQSTGDPEEVDLAKSNNGWMVELKTISGKSLEELVEQAAAYEYKHKVSGVRIDSEITQNDWVMASFPYRYKGASYTGTIIAKHKGNTYIYKNLSFSPNLDQEGKMLPFVPGNGSSSIGSTEGYSFSYFEGTVNDERIKQIVLHFDNASEVIPIEDDQLTYLINDERGENGESDRNLQYIEGLDQEGRTVYTWQY